MRLAADLHIHSCLSPCADNDMTPNNIVNMSLLKGLQVISVTDHNAGFNLEATAQAAEGTGIVFLPGIEVTTAEEIHALVYFARVEEAVTFGREIYDSLPAQPNDEALFGEQLILDAQDREIGRAQKLLLQACPLSIDRLAERAKKAGGTVVPAHINKPAYSMIANLGFVPRASYTKTLEVRRELPLPPLPEDSKIISSSDAHTLADILERVEWMEVQSASAANVWKLLDG